MSDEYLTYNQLLSDCIIAQVGCGLQMSKNANKDKGEDHIKYLNSVTVYSLNNEPITSQSPRMKLASLILKNSACFLKKI